LAPSWVSFLLHSCVINVSVALASLG
jgi:hypothetical protein